ILEPHDGIDVAERIRFVLIQPQIVPNRYPFGNYLSEFLPVPSLRTLRRGEIIRNHPIPRISHTGELIQVSKLLAAEGIAVLTERRVFLDLVIWIAHSESLDPVLLFT